MYLDLHYMLGGMRTDNKHSFSFQACVNMKPNPSRVLYGSSLCKNEPVFDWHLVIAFYLLNFARWALVVSFHRHHLFGWSVAFTWLFFLSWGTAAMSGFIGQPLDHYTFWAVPPLPEPVATLYTTRSSRTSLLYALFWLVKNEKIAEYFSLFDSLKRIKMEVRFLALFRPFKGEKIAEFALLTR